MLKEYGLQYILPSATSVSIARTHVFHKFLQRVVC